MLALGTLGRAALWASTVSLAASCLLERGIDRQHVLGAFGCLNGPGRCLLNESNGGKSAEKTRTRHRDSFVTTEPATDLRRDLHV